ncbi:MAG: dTDP-4-dehydrorhamnose reductase [Pyrinomonadaceae bacterium]|nr:dTDP-4-dehydrorhamnose reductase [Pyrinomonadaceae bacterium]
MVGRAVRRHCESSGDFVIAYDRQSLDVSDPDLVMQTILANKPEAIINCAACTDVDGCELDHERAYAANRDGPENLAKASEAVNATLVTISTDYVFDGKKAGFYTQEDTPNPVSVYGRSKLEGELRAQAAHPSATIVVRSGFIFGKGGTNFLSTVVERARRREKLKAISDSFGTPTYAWDLGVRLRELSQLKHAGIFHVVNAGDGTSYEEFARAALDAGGLAGASLESVEMDSLHRPAPRPRNSRLKCLTTPAIGLPPLPFWKDSLVDFVTLGESWGVKSEAGANG